MSILMNIFRIVSQEGGEQILNAPQLAYLSVPGKYGVPCRAVNGR